ncbi:MAG TPA: hypothetical protein VLI90_06185, partial [Tepidisphaeraceae bacterium]|nr:hypothetical protein [Tepidisphaeraceae bacterium]
MQIAGKSSGRNARRACASCALLTVAALTGRASGQTWVGNTQDWNTASNWSPAVVPNSTSAAAVFPSFGSGLSTVNISASVSAQSLSFTNTSGQYLISGGANQTLSGVTTINVSAGGTGAVGIGLTSVATGNLLFPSGGNLTINNNNANSGSFLVFGSGSVIGTPGTGGVVFNGAGLTSFIGSFAALGSPNNMVVGGITANGPGEVVLGGDGTNLGGSLTLNGGLMQLDYVPTTATKIASSNPLNLNGGTLQFFTGNGVITQNFSTTNVGAGDTDVQGIINTGGTGNVTFGAGAINHSVAGTVDFQPQSGVLAITTSTGNTGGLLGTGPAFATVNGGANWAMALGGNVTAVTTYGTDNYASGVNTDVTTSTTKFSGITTNSLRFNTNAPTVLTLTGNNTIQSGGILVTPNFTDANGAQITGGSINATANGELLFHVYGSALEIFSNLVSTAGLTKTGPGLLLLEASSPGLTGPININRGSLEVLVNTSAVNSASQINFNDNRLNSVQQMTVDLGFGASGTISRPIRVAAPGGLSGPEDFGTLFTTGNSVNSTVTLSGAISSPAGLNTPICFQALDGSSQFNLTNSGNSFSGNVILKQGSLGISSNGTLGAGGNTLYLDTLGNGGLVFLNSGVTLTHAMTINTETPIVCNGTDSNTISGAITSFLNSGIDKQGTGTLTLTGSTTASLGNFNVDGGTLALTGAAVGVASGVNVFVQTGGTFNAGSAQSQHYGFIDLLGGTFTATSAGPGFIFVNQILDTAGGSINLGNAGSLVLALQGSGAGISVSGNSTWVSPGNSATIGNLTGTPAPISIKPGVTLTNGIALSGVSGFTVTGGGTLFQNSDATNVLNMTAPITVGAASTFRVADASSHSGLGNFGTGAFTLDGGTFEFSGAPVTTSKSIAIT